MLFLKPKCDSQGWMPVHFFLFIVIAFKIWTVAYRASAFSSIYFKCFSSIWFQAYDFQDKFKESFKTLFLSLNVCMCCECWVATNYEVILVNLLFVHKRLYSWHTDAAGSHERSLAERWEIGFLSAAAFECLSSKFHGLLRHDCKKQHRLQY